MPKLNNKTVWSIVVIQCTLSIVAIHKDAQTIIDFVGMTLLTSGGAIFLSSFYTLCKNYPKIRAACLGSFLLTSICAIALLTFIAVTVIFQGPLKESGLIFIAFLIYYIPLGIVGAIIGLAVFFIKKRAI